MKQKPFIRQKVIHCGKQNRKTEYIEVDIFPYTETDRRRRKQKENVSLPKQKDLNDKNSKRHLVQLVKSNFTTGDYFFTATYAKEPDTVEEAEHDVQLYIRRLKGLYKKAGLKLKYVHVIEYGKKNGRIHHHMIINGGIDRNAVENCWKLGIVNTKSVQEHTTGIESAANYLLKSSAEKSKKRWKSSQGLVRPWVTTSDDKYSRRMIDKMANLPPDCEETKNFWERKFPDYVLYECQNYFNKETARWSIYLKMRLRR